jgi:DNA topoisomerase-1
VTDDVRLIAGEATTEFTGTGTGTRDRRQRGRVVAVVKPDRTVLVHDAAGYQPVAWLTRPESLFVERDPTVLTATDGDQRLRVTVHEETLRETVPASQAGVPVGVCPTCSPVTDGGERGVDSAAEHPEDEGVGVGVLVRSRGNVHCTACEARYGLPSGATVLDSTCGDCGLPLLRATRGAAFEVCLDRSCGSLAETVREAFDRAWDCPACGEDLRVLERGGIVAGCAAYPDCETAFSVPDGLAVGTCACGLPTFETRGGERCLDRTCEG